MPIGLETFVPARCRSDQAPEGLHDLLRDEAGDLARHGPDRGEEAEPGARRARSRGGSGRRRAARAPGRAGAPRPSRTIGERELLAARVADRRRRSRRLSRASPYDRDDAVARPARPTVCAGDCDCPAWSSGATVRDRLAWPLPATVMNRKVKSDDRERDVGGRAPRRWRSRRSPGRRPSSTRPSPSAYRRGAR